MMPSNLVSAKKSSARFLLSKINFIKFAGPFLELYRSFFAFASSFEFNNRRITFLEFPERFHIVFKGSDRIITQLKNYVPRFHTGLLSRSSIAYSINPYAGSPKTVNWHNAEGHIES